MTSLEQIRAARAFAKASLAAGRDDSGDYLRVAQNLPAMLQNNGLLASWAFLLSKSKNSQVHKDVLEALLEHFKDNHFGLNVSRNLRTDTFFTQKLTNGDSPISGAELMKITSEALIYSGWLKRAAEALCDKEGGQS